MMAKSACDMKQKENSDVCTELRKDRELEMVSCGCWPVGIVYW